MATIEDMEAAYTTAVDAGTATGYALAEGLKPNFEGIMLTLGGIEAQLTRIADALEGWHADAEALDESKDEE
jgi:hypothetical protein